MPRIYLNSREDLEAFAMGGVEDSIIMLSKGIVDRSFLIRKPDPLISIFNEPKHIFDGFYGKSDYFPRLK